MPAPKKNQYYLLRVRSGVERKYKTQTALANIASEYLTFTQENPLFVSQIVSQPRTEFIDYDDVDSEGNTVVKQKKVVHSVSVMQVPKMRIPTVTGFCLYAKISLDTFKRYESNTKERPEDEDLSGVATAIRLTIEQLQTEGAAANLLNASLMARILGLIDKKEVDNKGAISIRIDTEDAKLGE